MFNNRVFYKTVDSTNDLLLKLVREKKVEKNTVLIADFQIKGRGQRNKKWHAERDKNLLISLFLKPDNFLTKNVIYFNIITSLSIVYVLKKYIRDLNISIKWPNDIFINKQKIAGILIETSVLKRRVKQVIVGCGININQEEFPFSNNKPTSLFLILKKEVDRQEFLGVFLKNYSHFFKLLQKKKYSTLKKEYLKFLNNSKMSSIIFN